MYEFRVRWCCVSNAFNGSMLSCFVCKGKRQMDAWFCQNTHYRWIWDSPSSVAQSMVYWFTHLQCAHAVKKTQQELINSDICNTLPCVHQASWMAMHGNFSVHGFWKTNAACGWQLDHNLTCFLQFGNVKMLWSWSNVCRRKAGLDCSPGPVAEGMMKAVSKQMSNRVGDVSCLNKAQPCAYLQIKWTWTLWLILMSRSCLSYRPVVTKHVQSVWLCACICPVFHVWWHNHIRQLV